MATIIGSLASGKTPKNPIVIDWSEGLEGATLFVKGSTLTDLDNRCTVNQLIRAFNPTGKVTNQVIQPATSDRIHWNGVSVEKSLVEQGLTYFVELATENAEAIEACQNAIELLPRNLVKLTDISAHQKLVRDLSEFRELEQKYEGCINAARSCLENLAQRLSVDKSTSDTECRMPIVQPGHPKISFRFRGNGILPRPLIPWFINFWQSVRFQSPRGLQFCPSNRMTETGKPLPMSDGDAALLHDYSSGKVRSPPVELLAHYWLIISWNQSRMGRKELVAMPKGSRSPYSRKAGDWRQKRASQQDKIQSLQKELKELRSKLDEGTGEGNVPPTVPGTYQWEIPMDSKLVTFLTNFWGASEQRNISYADGVLKYTPTKSMAGKPDLFIPLIEEWISMRREMAKMDSALESFHEYLTELEEAKSQPSPEYHPAVIFEGAVAWFLDPNNVPGPKLSRDINGVPYFKSAKTMNPDPVPTTSERRIVRYKPSSEPGAPPKEESPEAPKKEKKKQGRTVEDANPLRVKGMPRSSLLGDEQKARLRKALGIPAADPVDPAVWDTMSNAQRSAYRKACSIPRWASQLVSSNSGNLLLIEQGIITSKNRRAALTKKDATKFPSMGSVSVAWGNLKKKFPKTRLLLRPQSANEKALKRSYDALVKQFGKNHPNLPKPESKRDTAGTRARSKKADNPLKGIEGLLPIIGIIGRLAKAFG